MLSVKNLTFQYPNTDSFHFPDFHANIHEPLLILGQSGCGKTTLLHLLAGLLRPKAGSISLAKTELTQLSASQTDHFRGKHIGLVYQKGYFLDALTVLDNLLISPFSISKKEAFALAEQLQIGHLLSKRPQQLSVGEQQRVSIARALLHQPKLILADEPTSALDKDNCLNVIDLLTAQAQKNKAALVIVTHDERLQARISNQIQLTPQVLVRP